MMIQRQNETVEDFKEHFSFSDNLPEAQPLAPIRQELPKVLVSNQLNESQNSLYSSNNGGDSCTEDFAEQYRKKQEAMLSELKSIYDEKEWARQKLSQLAEDFQFIGEAREAAPSNVESY